MTHRLIMNSPLKLQVLLWSVDQVCAWAAKLGFSPAPFAETRVDGDLLLQLDEKNLKEDLAMNNGIHRKRFLRELNKLKKSADYSDKDVFGIVDFLVNKIGAEFKVYAYNLISNELNLTMMQKLGEVDLADVLKDVGIESTIHRRRIVEAVFKEVRMGSVGIK